MRRSTLVTSMLVVLLVVAREGIAIPAAQEEWSRARTKSFVLVGNTSPKRLREIAVRLERFRAVLQAGRETEAERTALPTTIVVFKNEAAFAPYKTQTDGQPAAYRGVFQEGLDCNYIGMNGDPDNDPFEIIYHEYVHFFLSRRYGDVPLWLNEGLAEFYSTFRMDENEIEIGRPVENHVQYLAAMGLIPLVDLFALDESSKDYSEGRRAGVIYAESWALVHFFFLGKPELTPKLQKFLDLTAGSQTPMKAFPTAFEMTTGQLETALGTYILEGSFNYQQMRITDVSIDQSAQVEPMPRAELLYTLGDYLRHVTPWRQRDAEDHFREALRADAGHARAHVGLACLLEKSGKWVDAQGHFDKGIELGREDDLTYFLYGNTLLEHYMSGALNIPSNPSTLPVTVQASRGLLGRCLELNPNRAEAFVGLGKTYLYDPGDTQAGIAALEQGRGLLPARMDIPYYLMMLYVRTGERDIAEGLANQVLVHSEDPKIREMAKEVLANDDARRQNNRYQDAIDKLNAGDLDGGITILEQLGANAPDAEMRSEVEKLLGEARAAKQEKARIDGLNQQIEQYNGAIAKARSGDTAGARAMLEQLARTVQDVDLSRRVNEALEHLKPTALPKSSGR